MKISLERKGHHLWCKRTTSASAVSLLTWTDELSRHVCRHHPRQGATSVPGNPRRQLPRSTAPRKSWISALNAVGSSRLIAWPVLGQIHRPALGRVDLSIRLVSRQRTSSSPTASNTGTVISENWSRKSCNDGRKAWQRAIVFDIPSPECCRRRTMNSHQLFWSLYLSWMRAGPRAIRSAIETIPCSIKIRARSDVSLNQASRWERLEPDPTLAATVALVFS